MKIALASHSALDPNLVVGSHHLARQFAKLGHEVLHLSAPVTWLHAVQLHDRRVRYRMGGMLRGPRTVSKNLWEWIPLARLPWQAVRRNDLTQPNAFVPSRSAVRRALKRMGWSGVDLLLIDEPRLVGIDQLLCPGCLAYRATDLYARMKNDSTIDQAERILCNRADIVLATSRPVSDHLHQLSGREVRTIENGVDLSHFCPIRRPHSTLEHFSKPRIVYVGAVDFRFDSAIVNNLAHRFPNASFVVYGPISITFVPSASNVHIMGPISYAELPSVLQHCDVGLLPTNDHPANGARSPMKLYEYAAAGLRVLARATDELERRESKHIFLYKDSDEAAAKLSELMGASANEIDVSCVDDHGWHRKAIQILNAIEPNIAHPPSEKSCRPFQEEATSP